MILTIFFTILKILGILILVLLLLIALILLVPIRYRFEGYKKEESTPYAMVKVSWFLVLFSFKVEYVESKLSYRLRFLSKTLLTSEEEERNQSKSGKKKAKKKVKKKTKNKTKSTIINKEDIKEDSKKDTKEKTKEDAKEDVITVPETQRSEAGSREKNNVEKPSPKEKRPEKEKHSEKDKGYQKEEPASKGKLDGIKDKVNSLKEFDEEYHIRAMLPFLKKQIMKLLKHILPLRLHGNLVFGFEDPSMTGRITGWAAIFYPKYRKTFSLYPDFHEKRLAADMKGRGRIRLGYLIYLALITILNKDVRTLIFKLL